MQQKTTKLRNNGHCDLPPRAHAPSDSIFLKTMHACMHLPDATPQPWRASTRYSPCPHCGHTWPHSLQTLANHIPRTPSARRHSPQRAGASLGRESGGRALSQTLTCAMCTLPQGVALNGTHCRSNFHGSNLLARVGFTNPLDQWCQQASSSLRIKYGQALSALLSDNCS